MGKGVNEVIPEINPLAGGVRGIDPATYFRTHLLKRITPTPVWQNHGDHDLPLLTLPEDLRTTWIMDFKGAANRAMTTYAFETKPGSTVKYIGVTAPSGSAPDAYLIYFRHSARGSDYPNGAGLLEKGVGDYLEGRMQVSRQISASGKNVAAVVPVAVGGSGEFESSEEFVTKCLQEIDRELTGTTRTLPPLLLASNSDGIQKMNTFLTSCKGLVGKVKAIYDFDGSKVIAARGISLAGVIKGRVFRYDGSGALTANQKESEASFLLRTLNSNPARIPLPFSRWVNHGWYHGTGDPNYLHHFIPTCMLHHGLASTPGL